jgi:hypothetical protein
LFRFRAHESVNIAPLLLGNEQFRVTNNIDEQDVADLELDFFLNLRGHLVTLRKNEAMDNARLLPTVEV